MGLETVTAEVDPAGLKDRVDGIVDQLNRSITGLLESQRVRLIKGTARFLGPHEVEVTTVDGIEVLPADAVLISTGSRPRIPDFVPARRRPRAHHPGLLPAEGHPRARGGHRLRASPAWSSSTCSPRSARR